MSIDIPTDNDGYVLLQCSLCHEHFKVTPTDYQDEGVPWLYCPNCGLIAENYLTDDVIELALDIAQNLACATLNRGLVRVRNWTKRKFATMNLKKLAMWVFENPSGRLLFIQFAT